MEALVLQVFLGNSTCAPVPARCPGYAQALSAAAPVMAVSGDVCRSEGEPWQRGMGMGHIKDPTGALG